MSLSKNYELNKFLGRVFEEWRIFDMIDEVPTINANILPWIYTLWFQIGVLCLFLIVFFVLLKWESKRLNKEAFEERSNTGRNEMLDKWRNIGDRTYKVGPIVGLHDAVIKYYQEKNSVCPFS